MIWIGAATLVAFVLIRGLPQLAPLVPAAFASDSPEFGFHRDH